MNKLETRSTEQVLDDHLLLRAENDIEADIARNYAPDVVLLTAIGRQTGHQAVRAFHHILRKHVPTPYRIPVKLTQGPFAFIEWRAGGPDCSVDDGADGFVIQGGKIVCQTIHYSLRAVMPT